MSVNGVPLGFFGLESSANYDPKSDPSLSLVELLQSPLQDPVRIYPKYAKNVQQRLRLAFSLGEPLHRTGEALM
jgi:hypothetical protein